MTPAARYGRAARGELACARAKRTEETTRAAFLLLMRENGTSRKTISSITGPETVTGSFSLTELYKRLVGEKVIINDMSSRDNAWSSKDRGSRSQEGGELPEGMTMPEDMAPPEGAEQPGDMTPPEGLELPDDQAGGMQWPDRSGLATDTDMPQRPGGEGFTREDGGKQDGDGGEKPQRQGGRGQYAQDAGDAGSEDTGSDADDAGAARRDTP